MNKKFLVAVILLCVFCTAEVVMALDRPYIGVTFFYWYTWDYKKEWGSWIDGGVDNTPLTGYYNSPSYADNYSSLRTASEWGVTHHFMDFWGRGWKASDNKTPRETIVMKAAEDLQKEGYDIWMSFYQDGEKFNMKDFSQNISDPNNDDVRFWLDNYAKSPVWPKWQGKPFWLVYGRNGRPAQTAENTGFREYLKNKYNEIDKLNKIWETTHNSFEEISLNFSSGWQRVESINYQYKVWQESMEKMNSLQKEKYGFPGIIPSFDIWCEPYGSYGYTNYHKVFGGPHSYGGIFSLPETQDPQRFIQNAVAKYYDTIFWDHYKNFYCDWNAESRIPGTQYYPEPFNFDRFWVGDLMRYAEAVLHLSWNEWWEGSNMEPDLEHGKKFCEKLLFYSTIMKECFDSIHNYSRGAKVAVLLNDWSWMWGGNTAGDIYGVIQSLRLFGIIFDLIPDDFVDAKKLENFDLVVAPSNGTCFGLNKDGKSIAKTLQEWVEQKSGRRLIVSSSPEFEKYLGLSEGKDKVKGAEKKSMDFLKGDKEKNLAWIIPGEQDKNNNLRISPSAEGEIKVVKKGGRDAKTVGENLRSKTTRYMYFNVDDNFILNGNWPEVKLTVEYFDEGEGEVGIQYDSLDMNVKISATPGSFKSAGEKIALENSGKWKTFTWAIDDARFANSSNGNDFRLYMGGEFVVGKVTVEKIGEPDALVLLDSAIFAEEQGKLLPTPTPKHISHTIGSGKPLSYYNSDLTARDVVFSKGKGEVLYVNDLAGVVDYKPYWEKILSSWARIDLPRTVHGDNVRGTRLYSGASNILLAYNYDSTKKTSCVMRLASYGEPVSEVVALRSDGNEFKAIPYEIKDGKVQFQDEIQYFGVYEIVFSPLAISHKPLLLHPGEKTTVELTLKNLSDKPISGTLKLKLIVPTLGSDVLSYSLGAKEEKRFNLNVWAKDSVDWGNKTIMWEITWNSSAEARPRQSVAVYWRPLFVERNPDLTIITKVIDWRNPVLSIKNQEYKAATPKEKGFCTNAIAKDVVVTIDGKSFSFGDISSNQGVSKPLTLNPLTPSSVSIERKVVKISYLQNGEKVNIEDTISLMVYPEPKQTDKELRFYVCNSSEKEEADRLFKIDVPRDLSSPFCVLSESGEKITAQVVEDKLLFVAPFIGSETCVLYTIQKGKQGSDTTDLILSSANLNSGKGTLTVSNNYYSLTLGEEKGGSAINFVSAKSNEDYAFNSFGLNYGQFFQHDDLKPRQSATEFISEKKTRQSDKPGKIQVLVDGPIYKKVKVSWNDENIEASQVYEFFAGQREFRVTVDVKPKNRALDCQELVAFDACFFRSGIKKIFPGGSGMERTTEGFKKEVPHAGFRYTEYVHPYSMLVGKGENISLIFEEKSGLNKYRQGFWPQERPKAGKIKYAQVEYCSLYPKEPVHLVLWVMLHSGSHKKAKDFQSELVSPLCIVSKM